MQNKKTKFQIADQIKKLIKLARSEKEIGNVEAAARCDEKIADLRAKYDITAEIVIEDETVDFDGEPYFTRDSDLFRRRRIFWQEVLGGSTAVFFDCTTIVFKNSNLQVVIGDRENRKSAVECFHLLYRQGTEAAKEFSKNAVSQDARLQSQSFLLGFALGVQQRYAGYKYNEAQVSRYRHHLPESDAPKNPEGIVKSERIVVAEKTAREERIKETTSGLKKSPTPVINALDDDAYLEGIRFGHSCDFPEAVEAAARKVDEQLDEIEREMRRQHEERTRRTRSVGFYLDLGQSSGDYTATTTTFYGTQINLKFD